MKIHTLRLRRIRCFEDTGHLSFSPRCNLFIGANNTGKTTLLRGITAFQGLPFEETDIRPGDTPSPYHELWIEANRTHVSGKRRDGTFQLVRKIGGEIPQEMSFAQSHGFTSLEVAAGHQPFVSSRPQHAIVPFIARRKTMSFDESVSEASQQVVNGTFSNLYSRVDQLSTDGHSAFDKFRQAVLDIVGLRITTKASPNGKQAGFFFDDSKFIPMDRMGDGVPELVGLIVELCIEKSKVFVIEEPETNLHPSGLKALLGLVRESWDQNQFFIATHSNIVLRELGYDTSTKVFRLERESRDRGASSRVIELTQDTAAHVNVLRELGYEFGDLALHDGWLFLEESSAESVISQVLIPEFAPGLLGRLRTFSASGVTNVEPSIAEFQRLVTFVHLQPAYRDRLWIRVDGDPAGVETSAKLRNRFDHLNEETCSSFLKPNFEEYYPSQFREQAAKALAQPKGPARRAAKAELLREVLAWTHANESEALSAWAESASEIIDFLKGLESRL